MCETVLMTSTSPRFTQALLNPIIKALPAPGHLLHLPNLPTPHASIPQIQHNVASFLSGHRGRSNTQDALSTNNGTPCFSSLCYTVLTFAVPAYSLPSNGALLLILFRLLLRLFQFILLWLE